MADYLQTLDISSFDPKAPPPKTEAFWEMVNANRAPEVGPVADALDTLGNPAAFTIADLKQTADSDLLIWLSDRKNSRVSVHRIEDCGYGPTRNPDAKDGLWRVAGHRQVIYTRSALLLQEQIRAARERLIRP